MTFIFQRIKYKSGPEPYLTKSESYFAASYINEMVLNLEGLDKF
jgi:hypothetical protein